MSENWSNTNFLEQRIRALIDLWRDPEHWSREGNKMDSHDCAVALETALWAQAVNAGASPVAAGVTASAQDSSSSVSRETPGGGTGESPIFAFQVWVARYVVAFGRLLTQDEYALAQSAFFAAHPGQGPTSALMGAPGGTGLPPDVEHRLREHLWLSHGHQGIYGDDGEMQCSECAPMWDYKRAPLKDVITAAITARAAVNLKLLASLPAPPGASVAPPAAEVPELAKAFIAGWNAHVDDGGPRLTDSFQVSPTQPVALAAPLTALVETWRKRAIP